jgi:LacI family transcriptional regulator
MAVGVIARLMSRGLSVPDDVSVIGYDDQESLADQFPPTLTTVSIPHYEFGRAAIQTLLNHLIDQSPLQDQTIRGELVWRGSVGPPRLDSSARTKLAQTGGQRFAS